MDDKIIFFQDISEARRGLVGGKGVNLGILTNAGIPVPKGFCVTSSVYQDFIARNSLGPFLQGNPDGAQIRERLRQSALPDDLETEVAEALSRFDAGTYFAVRSSATAEDLPFASFAGQQDTYLNVSGLSGILDAIRNCWASLYTDRAIAYRQKQGIASEQVYMAVVVQKMVLSEQSGILFTADPVSENRQIISIDAGFGLGEALVSGIVSPDSYKYDKPSGEIIHKLVPEKKLAIYPLAGGGTEQVTLEAGKAASQVLDDDTIRTLAKLGEKIEAHYGAPQDIEWCIEQGRIYIVQARAITSLFPLPEPMPDDGKLHPYLSFGHAQMMTAPISPAGIDLLRMFFRNDDVPFARYKPVFIRQAAGRIFIDASGILQYRFARKRFPHLIANVDFLISESLLSLIGREGFEHDVARAKGFFWDFFKFAHRIPPKAIKKMLFEDTTGTIQKLNGFVDETIASVSEKILAAGTAHDKLLAIYGSICIFKPILQNLGPYMIPGLLSMKRLESLEETLLGSGKYARAVMEGLEGNVTTEMGLLMGDLADYVRESPPLRREFEHGDYASFFTRIEKLPGDAAFKDLLDRFMRTYGVRAAGEIDLATERWADNPEPFINAVLSMADGMTKGQHREEFAETRRASLATAEEFVAAVRQRHGQAKAKKVARTIQLARDCMPVREHPKFIIMHIFYAARKALLEEADRLVEAGRLDDRRDIFLLGLWELDRALADGEDMKAKIAERKAEYARYRTLSPPRVTTNYGEIIKASYDKKDLPQGALVGVGVSSGVIEGIAKVVLDPTGANVEKGEILVAPYTDPGWTTLFINAAGLVTEVGGLLTHGTVVAREYGIPAVVGCENATSLIKTGQKIRVDGNNGFVIPAET